ncbi:LOW QUALITY PROTEIN: hypothetical protein KUTeg_021565 [Tegillarca granosa]|uniref:Transmembrane protein n=1 Tax=Tegillarca granosa TaxID=220873 RepID=A0ABQ9E6J4_TEGGR|nr:LOW QUALITY PROTEIN: hypothetical protein KUTeg_021565 [Tegillarca granosa]
MNNLMKQNLQFYKKDLLLTLYYYILINLIKIDIFFMKIKMHTFLKKYYFHFRCIFFKNYNQNNEILCKKSFVWMNFTEDFKTFTLNMTQKKQNNKLNNYTELKHHLKTIRILLKKLIHV